MLVTMSGMREWQGMRIPSPGTWRIHPPGSEVALVASYLRVASLRMRFRRFDGLIRVTDEPEQTSLEATIQAKSIDTGIRVLDRILRAPRILDVERFPALGFTSTEIRLAGGSGLRMSGDLTIRDVTRPVTLQVEYRGGTTDSDGRARARFWAWAAIAHEEFLTWKQLLSVRSWVIGRRVRIELDIEALRE